MPRNIFKAVLAKFENVVISKPSFFIDFCQINIFTYSLLITFWSLPLSFLQFTPKLAFVSVFKSLERKLRVFYFDFNALSDSRFFNSNKILGECGTEKVELAKGEPRGKLLSTK